MPKYRLIKGSHSGFAGSKRTEYRAGVAGQDILELTEAQADLPHLRKRIEKYHGPESVGTSIQFKPDDSDDDDAQDIDDPKISGVLSGNVEQVLAYINDHADGEDTLEALRTAEKSDKNRKAVMNALNDLLGE